MQPAPNATPSRAACKCSASPRGTLSIRRSAGQQEARPQDHGVVKALRSVLLRNAASRLDRGPVSCLRCRGAGQCSCEQCKGSGLVTPPGGPTAWIKGSVLGAMFNKALGASANYRVTNRCPKCHGTGKTPCSACGGRGQHNLKLPVEEGASAAR